MLIYNTLAALSLVLIYIVPFNAQSAASISYLEPQSAEDETTLATLKGQDDIESLIQLVNETINISDPLKIIFGTDDGPLYDPQANEVWVPYFFIQEVHERFEKNNYSQTGISNAEATNDALIHTLLHEIGHAFIVMFDLPIVGKEEDAADSLAIVLLTQFYEDGGDMAISAADLFELEDADIETFEEADFWDEHSLDIQRYYTILCQVYGSNPEKHKMIINEELLPKGKGEQCEADFSITQNSWMSLLEPHLRKPLDD